MHKVHIHFYKDNVLCNFIPKKLLFALILVKYSNIKIAEKLTVKQKLTVEHPRF